MNCCSDDPEVRPLRVNGRLASLHDNLIEFKRPVKHRSTTDVICLVIFVQFFLIGAIILIVAFVKGDPGRLVHGMDKDGNVCGRNNRKIEGFPRSGVDMTDKKYLVGDECLKDCPSAFKKGSYGFTCEYTDEILEIENYLYADSKDFDWIWPHIFCICVFGWALSLTAFFMLRYKPDVIVWITVGLTVVSSFIATIFLWFKWNEQNATYFSVGYLAGAIIMTIFTIFILIILIALRKQIVCVIQLFKEAGTAIKDMPFMLLQPIWTLLVVIIVIIIFVVGLFHMISAGDIKKRSGIAYVETDTIILNMRWYHVFGFFWFIQFVFACHFTIIAGSIATWYFTRDKSRLKSPILRSTGTTLRYHIGSLAFGSLLMSSVKMIRAILFYLQSKTTFRENSVCGCICFCCHCCIYWIQKVVMLFSRNAYVEIAIYGCNFCEGVKKASKVLAHNALKIATLNFAGDFILYLLNIVIVSLTVLFGYLILQNSSDLETTVPPLIIVALITSLIAYCFSSVFEMAMDTLLICYCEDCDINDGIENPFYMNKGLMKFMVSSKKAFGSLDKSENKDEEDKISIGSNSGRRPSFFMTTQVSPEHPPSIHVAFVNPPPAENKNESTTVVEHNKDDKNDFSSCPSSNLKQSTDTIEITQDYQIESENTGSTQPTNDGGNDNSNLTPQQPTDTTEITPDLHPPPNPKTEVLLGDFEGYIDVEDCSSVICEEGQIDNSRSTRKQSIVNTSDKQLPQTPVIPNAVEGEENKADETPVEPNNTSI